MKKNKDKQAMHAGSNTGTTLRSPAEDIIKGASENDQLHRLAENAAKSPVEEKDKTGASPGKGPRSRKKNDTR
jgi:hypothetical protein